MLGWEGVNVELFCLFFFSFDPNQNANEKIYKPFKNVKHSIDFFVLLACLLEQSDFCAKKMMKKVYARNLNKNVLSINGSYTDWL